MILPVVGELLAKPLRHPAMEGALEALRRGGRSVSLSGLQDTAKAFAAACMAFDLRRPLFLVVESNSRAEAMLELLRFFYAARGGRATDVDILPALDVLPRQGLSPHPEILEKRAAALCRLASRQVALAVVSLGAALWRYHSAEEYAGLARTLEPDQELSLEDLVGHLAAVGYERAETVEFPGQFAVRGGIVDAFSPEAPRPVRIELLGDTLESLREFDPRTQRSVAPLVRVALLPLTEFIGPNADIFDAAPLSAKPPGSSGLAGETTFFELAGPAERSVLVWEEKGALFEAADQFARRAGELAAKRPELGGVPTEEFFWPLPEWEEKAAPTPQLALERLSLSEDAGVHFELPTRPSTRHHGNFMAFLGELKAEVRAGRNVLVAAATAGELERLADLCREYEVPYRLGESEASGAESMLAQGSEAGAAVAAVLVRAPLTEGVVFTECGVTICGYGDIFGLEQPSEAARRKPRTAGFFSDFSELKAGDFIVHVDHGIGQFEGLRQLQAQGRRGEFMQLLYAEEARLYVPLERMDLVQSYRAVEGVQPALDRLGGTAWTARKARVRRSLQEMADQLLQLYAQRKTLAGFAFSADTPWQREFEDAFEFEETTDQRSAIADVKRDMERRAPMDRLLCGDVGYGKTEVAMRAAFKAVSDGKQVALLAPTTILAFQHLETFRRRFAVFPVRIEMLSRFLSSREQKAVLAALEEGKVDVVVGTHRLLSKDVKFHDLGLLIVDEEQRFGVAHKERLKELRKEVDAMALSATPIPRTLNMSLVGLRDMSVIETPPKDRLAIQTVVAPFQENLVRRAIEEELARHGQVYFIHNRVESIHSVATLVKRLVPHARVVVGHGQMSDKELERVMLKFIRDDADVLVATTIVENGLDIGRANTILINRADRFGLAELYQLRGRVGRSSQRAYAYLLVPPEGSLPAIARRRLAALKEFSELGSGFRIAALDLELRGAGNLLGRQQHGHINAVGFDLYCQMLERAVSALKGEVPATELRCSLNLGMDIRIPADYIASESLRLRTYKRVAEVRSAEEKEDMRQELTDRFGALPPSVENLLEYAVLKSQCERLLIASIERQGAQVSVRFHAETPLDPSKLVALVRRGDGARFDPNGTLWLRWPDQTPFESLRNALLGLRP
jgi:transcription-repair coupling factor (superfamily II helicase)